MAEPLRWMAEITFTSGGPTRVVAFDEIHDLHEIIEQGPNWNEIDRIVVTLNLSSVTPRQEIGRRGTDARENGCGNG